MTIREVVKCATCAALKRRREVLEKLVRDTFAFLRPPPIRKKRKTRASK